MSDEEQECPAGAPLWMCTFADLMSLLLCFFVLLLSFSEIDRQKYKQVAGSMEKAFGMQRQRNVSDSPRQGLKVIAKDFDQPAIATRIKKQIGQELEDNFEELYGKIASGDEVKLTVRNGDKEEEISFKKPEKIQKQMIVGKQKVI